MSSNPVASGTVVSNGAVPYLTNSTNCIGVIHNGPGSYQVILDRPIKETYVLSLTLLEAAEQNLLVYERSDYQRSTKDFLFEVRDTNGHPTDGTVSFIVFGEYHG